MSTKGSNSPEMAAAKPVDPVVDEKAPATTVLPPAAPNASASAEDKTNPTGWVAKIGFDYTRYNATTKEEREAAEQSTGDDPEWAAGARKYEWKDEYGDVGPADEALEKILFRNDSIPRSGEQFQLLKKIPVTFESPINLEPITRFIDAGLHPVMVSNIKLCGYDVPTPIQAYCIPAVMRNYDVIACAQTGSGKTAAYLIPVLSKLMGKAKVLAAPRPDPTDPNGIPARAEPLVVIVAPTRELATQIFDECRRFCYRSMLRPCVVYGGAPVGQQRMELQKGCDIIIGTPGRLCDFMQKSNILVMNRVRYTIIDEADEMLNNDWEEELGMIMAGGDTTADADHIYMMFSATFPRGAREMARAHMAKDHIRIRVGRTGSTHGNVKQNIVFTDENRKRDALYDLLMSAPPTRTMIFVNTKRTADALDDFLYNRDLPCTSIHADRTQREREDALLSFRRGKTPILIATGVSSRGLDISNVMHVINYDLPRCDNAASGVDEYIHRIGRTARIGNVGLATSFYNDRNEDIAPVLVKVLLETKQTVPEFLQMYMPEGVEEGGEVSLDFQDDTSNEGSQGGEEQEGSPKGWGSTKGSEKGKDAAKPDDDAAKAFEEGPVAEVTAAVAETSTADW